MRRALIAVLVVGLSAAACSDPPRARVQPLRVIVTGELTLPDGAIEAFADERGIPLQISREDDPLRAIEAVLVSPDQAVADVVIGVPDAIIDDVGETLTMRDLPPEITPDVGPARGRPGLAPLLLLDMCLVYDRSALQAAGLSPPVGPTSLLDPIWTGRLVIPDPAEGLEGRLFLEALRSLFGDDPQSGWVSALGNLIGNGMVVAPSWRSAFDEVFASAAQPDGPPVTWGGSALPAVVLRLVDPLPNQSPLGVSTGAGCVRSVIGGVIPANAERPDVAEDLLEHLLSPQIQNQLFDDRGGLPVRPTDLPEVFTRFAIRPASPLPVQIPTSGQPGVVAVWDAITAPPTDG